MGDLTGSCPDGTSWTAGDTRTSIVARWPPYQHLISSKEISKTVSRAIRGATHFIIVLGASGQLDEGQQEDPPRQTVEQHAAAEETGRSCTNSAEKNNKGDKV